MGYLAHAIGVKGRMGVGRAVARVKTIQAPTGGWNARDPLSAMKPGFATILENWFPDTGFVALRKGNAEHAHSVGAGAVPSLFAFNSADTAILLASGDGDIYDVTSPGTATNLNAGTAFASDQWQGVNFYNVAILVNGEDTPQSFDGSTLASAGFSGSGLTTSNLIYAASFKERLFLVEKDTANAWYGGIKQITGALLKFDLGAVHPSGGALVAVGTFTLDGGAGPDDYIGFFFEKGDILVYRGLDPGDADLWAIVGRFKIGDPVGRQPLLQVGSDLIAITDDGYMPVAQFMATGGVKKQLAVSDNISRAVNEAVKLYRANLGWQLVLHSDANMLIANVPRVSGAQSEQHVQNTLTGAWCKFTGLNANCWAVSDHRIFFGGAGGKVFEFNVGNADDGATILSDAQGAYVYYGGQESEKHFTMFRPYLQTDNALNVQMGLGVNFAEAVVTAEVSLPEDSGSQFDEALFDEDFFGGGFTSQDEWQSAGEFGYAAAVRLKTATRAHAVRWFATGVVWEQGGIV
jgi:hypothetical protein